MVTVVFRSRLRPEGEQEYNDLAPRMLELAQKMPGFVSFERFTSEDGERLALVTFESLEELEAWRRHPDHLEAQRRGREALYAEYRIVVTEHVRSYSFDGDHRFTHSGGGPGRSAAGDHDEPSDPAPPVGEPLDWRLPERPAPRELLGECVLCRPLDPAGDARDLFEVSHPPNGDPAHWTYLPDGPYETPADLEKMLAWAEDSSDPLYFALVPVPRNKAMGIASYLRITPEFGVVEIGHIWFGAGLRKTAAATEAIYLLARHAFDDLGYRRLEWKCDALNAASRAAAERFGFTFEGVFRKHMVIKGRSRDTTWYAITDDEWPAIRSGFEAWLDPANLSGPGGQKRRLGNLIAEHKLDLGRAG